MRGPAPRTVARYCYRNGGPEMLFVPPAEPVSRPQHPLPDREEIASTLLSLARLTWFRRLADSLGVELGDAVGEAFARAAALKGFCPARGPLSAWLFAILRNELYGLGRTARQARA